MIYLIGISDHNIQHNGNNSADPFLRNKFSIFLKEKIKEHNIILVAEEFNEDALHKVSNGNIATVKNVVEELKSGKLKIEHRFCEPSEAYRKLKNILSPSEILSKKLNIHSYGESGPNLDKDQQKIFDSEIKKSFSARETFWFEKIGNYLDRNVIFVCGADHVRSFGALLTRKGYRPTVLIESWGK